MAQDINGSTNYLLAALRAVRGTHEPGMRAKPFIVQARARMAAASPSDLSPLPAKTPIISLA